MAVQGQNHRPCVCVCVGGWGGIVQGLGVSRFTILPRFFFMLVLIFCKLFEHYSQMNVPIIKAKGNKIYEKKYGRYLGQSG